VFSYQKGLGTSKKSQNNSNKKSFCKYWIEIEMLRKYELMEAMTI